MNSTIHQVIPIDRIQVGQRHRKDLGDIDELAASIQEVGLLQPLVVTPDYRLIAGERRFQALRRVGKEKVPVRVLDRLEDVRLALVAERDENTCRKDFTPSEAVVIGKQLEELERREAKERQESSRAKKGQRVGASVGGENFSPPMGKGKTRDRVGEAVGMSGPTYTKAKKVVEAAESDPGLTEVVEEMDRTGKVDPAYRKVAGRPKKPKPEVADDPDAGTATQALYLIEDALAEGGAGFAHCEAEGDREVPQGLLQALGGGGRGIPFSM